MANYWRGRGKRPIHTHQLPRRVVVSHPFYILIWQQILKTEEEAEEYQKIKSIFNKITSNEFFISIKCRSIAFAWPPSMHIVHSKNVCLFLMLIAKTYFVFCCFFPLYSDCDCVLRFRFIFFLLQPKNGVLCIISWRQNCGRARLCVRNKLSSCNRKMRTQLPIFSLPYDFNASRWHNYMIWLPLLRPSFPLSPRRLVAGVERHWVSNSMVFVSFDQA